MWYRTLPLVITSWLPWPFCLTSLRIGQHTWGKPRATSRRLIIATLEDLRSMRGPAFTWTWTIISYVSRVTLIDSRDAPSSSYLRLIDQRVLPAYSCGWHVNIADDFGGPNCWLPYPGKLDDISFHAMLLRDRLASTIWTTQRKLHKGQSQISCYGSIWPHTSPVYFRGKWGPWMYTSGEMDRTRWAFVYQMLYSPDVNA